ncbi:hypothetical protein BDM02DRAFT_277622 [Thelephora ganbajun]|uniref:Uncharacterized protein n=1 Tax=Thelephora ganbajun TaxID=370292 RepID=A0ACB6Z8Y5_THEGA|nr:hypothetical protein BDM02DRAFT_277622 [Thelephora ganbajun]
MSLASVFTPTLTALFATPSFISIDCSPENSALFCLLLLMVLGSSPSALRRRPVIQVGSSLSVWVSCARRRGLAPALCVMPGCRSSIPSKVNKKLGSILCGTVYQNEIRCKPAQCSDTSLRVVSINNWFRISGGSEPFQRKAMAPMGAAGRMRNSSGMIND